MEFDDFLKNYRTTDYLKGITGLDTARIRYILRNTDIKRIRTTRLYVHKGEFLDYIKNNPAEWLKVSKKGGV